MTVPGGPSMATFLLMIPDKVARGELPIEQSYKDGKLELKYARTHIVTFVGQCVFYRTSRDPDSGGWEFFSEAT